MVWIVGDKQIPSAVDGHVERRTQVGLGGNEAVAREIAASDNGRDASGFQVPQCGRRNIKGDLVNSPPVLDRHRLQPRGQRGKRKTDR